MTSVGSNSVRNGSRRYACLRALLMQCAVGNGRQWPQQVLHAYRLSSQKSATGIAVRLEDGLCYFTSAIRASPTMTSDIPLVNSRTLFLTQSAAFSLEANASSALSNMLTVISTSGPPSSR